MGASILYSTIDEPLGSQTVFDDPHALRLSVRCGIIPRRAGDSFNFTYYRGT